MAELYPLVSFHFIVDWNGTRIGFSEVSGLTVESEVVEYRHGAMPDHTKIKMSGQKKFSNISLKRGVVATDNEFFAWINSTKMNKPERRDLTISLLNEEHIPVMTWKITNAWPIKVEGPGLKADGNEVAIETIELAHEGLKIETV